MKLHCRLHMHLSIRTVACGFFKSGLPVVFVVAVVNKAWQAHHWSLRFPGKGSISAVAASNHATSPRVLIGRSSTSQNTRSQRKPTVSTHPGPQSRAKPPIVSSSFRPRHASSAPHHMISRYTRYFLVPCATLARRFAIAHAALCLLGIISFKFGLNLKRRQTRRKTRAGPSVAAKDGQGSKLATGRKVRSTQRRASAFATATKTTGAVNKTHERHVVHFANAHGRWKSLYVYGKKDIR